MGMLVGMTNPKDIHLSKPAVVALLNADRHVGSIVPVRDTKTKDNLLAAEMIGSNGGLTSLGAWTREWLLREAIEAAFGA